jgi:hypothetical protein
MEGDHKYYKELASRSRPNANASSVCSDFNRLLKSVSVPKRKDMSDWFLALVHQHQLVINGSTTRMPCKPEVGRGTRNCDLLTYDLSQLAPQLQDVLMCYMVDCLESQVSAREQ